MTAETRLAELLEIVEAPSNRGRLTHDWIAENLGLEVADTVYVAINSASPATALRFVAGVGIDTSADRWKQQAEAVAASIESLQPHLSTLRDFETIKRPRWQTEGYETEPTLDQVTAAIESDTKATMIANALDPLKTKLNNATASLGPEHVDGLTVAELQTRIDAVIASDAGLVD